MAKRLVSASDPAQDEELSVVVLKFKGSGETVRKGIDVVAQAIAALGPGTVQVIRQVNGRKGATQLGSAPAEAIETEAVEETETLESAEEAEAVTPATPKGPAKPRKLPKFDSTLAVSAFKAFAAARNPQTVDEKYLVACLWLQEDAQLASYGASKIFTCFRAMGDWPTYDDFTQPMRIMKLKKSYFADTDKRGEWKLTDHGLDEARKIKHTAAK